jgi:transcription antitermination factor NusG
MPYWACAQTEPRREAAAKHFLELARYQVYLPRLRLVRPSRGRRVETRPVLFPSYLFVLITVGWWTARWCPHVIRLLTAGDGPLHVPDAIVNGIKEREVGGLVELPGRDAFKPGDQVRILQGPLAGHLGLYAGMRPHERVLVLLALLGGQQRVELAKVDIEAVQSDVRKGI